MEWLHPFIALTLCSGVVLMLLPEGGLRRSAALAIGLMVTLCWLESLSGWLRWPEGVTAPVSVLTATGYTPDPGGDAHALAAP